MWVLFIKLKNFYFDLFVYMYIIVVNKSIVVWMDDDFSRL